MNWLMTKFISAFLLPPLNFLLLGIVGLAVSGKRPALGRSLVVLMMALLWIFSMPLTGSSLLRFLESQAAIARSGWFGAQAIVVLGGGANFDAPEFGGDTVGMATLERLRYAAVLQRQTGLPLLVAGGDPDGKGVAEAALMARVLEHEFNVPVRWLETASYNTRQNAVYSRKILQGSGVKSILLVTQGWHMPRAKLLFEHAGFEVRPAGTGFQGAARLTILDFLPNAKGLDGSRIFFHEAVGLLWAKLAD